jgi:MFS transporter, PAT family, beta-lactamase induction signal transducer AmpG
MKTKSPWAWVPTLYFAEGLPYVSVMTIAVIMFKRFGMSNTDIALYTSWLYLPWTVKCFWSPFVDILKTKRWWVVTMQLLLGACFGGIALSLPTPDWFRYSMAFFWLLAFGSATHDIAADGFYMLGLKDSEQAFFVGIRNTFYRIAMISGQGLLIVFAGELEEMQLPSWASEVGSIPFAWSSTFGLLAVFFILFSVYHRFVLPKPLSDAPTANVRATDIFTEFGKTFGSFFKKKDIVMGLIFLLFYRFAEAQLLKLSSPFLLDPRQEGGLGLSTIDVGTVYGIVGVIALIIGGILGGIVISRDGLKKWIRPMVLMLTLPNLTSIYFAFIQPESFWIINAGVAFEQFGYGFGFTAYTVYMLQFAKGEHQTAHYAFCTGFMALGMMLPGMIAGWIQEQIGYQHFFIYVMICSLIPIFVAERLRKRLTSESHPEEI